MTESGNEMTLVIRYPFGDETNIAMDMEVDDLLSVENGEERRGRRTDPCAFYVARVHPTVFSNNPDETLKPEFEAIFKAYSADVRFDYLQSFGRVRVTYTNPEQAERAREDLNHHIFQGTTLRIWPVKAYVIGSQTLGLPEKTKQFLLSPPASPPVDWEQSHEKTPSLGRFVDCSLVTALAGLQFPGTSQELQEATHATPSIVVVTPEDSEDLTPSVLREPHMMLSSLPAELRHTARPPIAYS